MIQKVEHILMTGENQSKLWDTIISNCHLYRKFCKYATDFNNTH